MQEQLWNFQSMYHMTDDHKVQASNREKCWTDMKSLEKLNKYDNELMKPKDILSCNSASDVL